MPWYLVICSTEYSLLTIPFRYKDQHSLEHHRLGPKLGELKRRAVDEGLFTRPPEIIPLALTGKVTRHDGA